ncbi:MAG: hypothetical protein HFI75_02425 [Lachnospiraceae bacterium]|nr:hypothetical protein [Lachnospiraceae bacterium]
MEKQLRMADELFDSLKKAKHMFSEDMAVYANGTSIYNTPSGYASLLESLYQILCVLDLQIGGMEQEIAALHALSSKIRKPENFSEFLICFHNAANSMLLRVIQYREYYCIIRNNDPIAGLGSHILTYLGQIAESLSEGYIPVIDMINVNHSFADLSRQANHNAWELFFRQPFDCQFSYDLKQNKHIIKDALPSDMPNCSMEFLTNPVLIDHWKWLMKAFMPFSSVIEDEIQSYLSVSPFHGEGRILGVLVRGTDYTAMRPYSYPVQPEVEEVVAKAQEVMQLYDCDYIYLATEDAKVLSAFEKNFHEQVVTTQDIYYSQVGQNYLAFVNEQHSIDLYQKNAEYLTALYLLSRCHCFIGGRTSGSVVSLLLSEHYDYFYVWNKGRYGMDDMFYDIF